MIRRDYIVKRAIDILRESYGAKAEFRDGQLESIILAITNPRTLVVQRTGWGKSVVYFIATKILREVGSGPTIIISPLLALMGNQIDAAKKIGIRAATINSSNKDDWDVIYNSIDRYDAIIVSPERLSDEKFEKTLRGIMGVRLLVIDEAHSISDWGNDFRPDYQRIVKLIQYMPDEIKVLGTTATANNRVIEDIKRQFGKIDVVRGGLMRDNIAIQVIGDLSKSERLSWMGHNLVNEPKFSGQGVIYCLTRNDCEVVSEYISKLGVSIEPYHSGLSEEDSARVLASFESGNIRVIASTIKLGMGYDKSDIRFVIHYQMPQNIISYYQQIGRAGRDGQKSYAIMLYGDEDLETIRFFIKNSFVDVDIIDKIVEAARYGAKISDMQKISNIKRASIEKAVKFLMVSGVLYKDGSVYRRNILSDFDLAAEHSRQSKVIEGKKSELMGLLEYAKTDRCYMDFVAEVLDAPDADRCGICKNCLFKDIINTTVPEISNELEEILNSVGMVIEPRKMWSNNKKISQEEMMSPGIVLSGDYGSRIGHLVKKGKYSDGFFSGDLLSMSVNLLRQRGIVDDNTVIIPVPSLRSPSLVADFAKKLAMELGCEYRGCVRKISAGEIQKTLNNSYFQQKNIEDSTIVEDYLIGRKVLLVDDMVDSKWTFTVIAKKLRRSGAIEVIPYALVDTSGVGLL